MADSDIEVAVVYALPAVQTVLRLRVAMGATAEQAIRQSGLMERYSDIDLATARIGIFGKTVTLNASLNAGDRVEIYRPLVVDPKEVRRRRVKLKK